MESAILLCFAFVLLTGSSAFNNFQNGKTFDYVVTRTDTNFTSLKVNVNVDNENDNVKLNDASKPNLYELALQLNLTIFAEALSESGLHKVVDHEGPFTIFAPTNEAFKNAPNYCKHVPLKNRMKYHITRGSTPMKELTNDQQLWTLLSKRYVEQCLRSADALLFRYATYAVNTTGLYDTIDTVDPITVFVPTDEAVQSLPDSIKEKLKTDKIYLKRTVLNHVVPMTIYKAGMSQGQVLKSASGKKMYISIKNDSVIINGRSRITLPDATVKNGVVHSIDRVLASRFPENPKFQLLFKNFDEFYAIFNAILHFHFLKKHSSSFSERFYGLRRINSAEKEENLLNSSSFRYSLISLVLEPYISSKLNKFYSKLLESQDKREAPLNSKFNQLKTNIGFLYLRIFPILEVIMKLTSFFFKLRYIFGKTDYYSPLLYFIKVCLTSSTISNSASSNVSHSWKSWIINGMFSSVSTVLFGGAFMLQFLQWYHSDENDNKIQFVWNKLPPPSKIKLNNDPEIVKSGLCPLCNKVRRNDTALQTSGYVFCYKCIFSHVKENGNCPITLQPSSLDHLQDTAFTGDALSGPEKSKVYTHYEYFYKFITDDMLEIVVQQSNEYSMEKNGTLAKLTFKELQLVIGMYLHMGLVKMPGVRMYWENATRSTCCRCNE
ncbi:Peroxisome assembly protein 12 [Nymphon striatum]|nr:Peroxisome assembly protein 12 [Nymphon striatum]